MLFRFFMLRMFHRDYNFVIQKHETHVEMEGKYIEISFIDVKVKI